MLSAPRAGLFWGTYFATLRREGVYVSGSCGAIDMNQELLDPVEEAMMVGWDQTMNNAMKALINSFGQAVQKECDSGNGTVFCPGLPFVCLSALWPWCRVHFLAVLE